jgi:hypothetical protein
MEPQTTEKDLARKIKKEARPGESYSDVVERLSKKDPGMTHSSKPEAKVIRHPPKGDEQADFFVPSLYDVGTKDSRSIMDVAVFRLSKKDKRAGDIIRYELPDGHVTVSSGASGMASVWDYDIILMAVSHLTEAMNKYRQGTGDKETIIWNSRGNFVAQNRGKTPWKNRGRKQHPPTAFPPLFHCAATSACGDRRE